MKYLLDTSVLKELISKQPNPNVVDFVDSHEHEDMFLSAITVGEIAKAIALLPNSPRKRELQQWLKDDLLIRFEGKIISLDSDIFIRWGELTAKLEAIGVLRPAIDSLIAATVLMHHMVLVTVDEDGFSDMEIEVVNPW
ncbi:MAG: type II toxin-antitoxin system VapC family toxin [Anaerolineales bacterium]|nr:type II toxin-antitoxin system VapC family toxin [Anaerolineales bacterium]